MYIRAGRMYLRERMASPATSSSLFSRIVKATSGLPARVDSTGFERGNGLRGGIARTRAARCGHTLSESSGFNYLQLVRIGTSSAVLNHGTGVSQLQTAKNPIIRRRYQGKSNEEVTPGFHRCCGDCVPSSTRPFRPSRTLTTAQHVRQAVTSRSSCHTATTL
jgi:hypothetical protein